MRLKGQSVARTVQTMFKSRSGFRVEISRPLVSRHLIYFLTGQTNESIANRPVFKVPSTLLHHHGSWFVFYNVSGLGAIAVDPRPVLTRCTVQLRAIGDR
jgi:hypothetical protein